MFFNALKSKGCLITSIIIAAIIILFNALILWIAMNHS